MNPPNNNNSGNFYGRYDVPMADGYRFTLPAKVRKQLFATNADNFWLAKHSEYSALILCTEHQWTIMKDGIKNIHGDAAERVFIAPSQPVTWDSKGRVYPPIDLCRYALMTPESQIVIVGLKHCFEIWAKKMFRTLG